MTLPLPSTRAQITSAWVLSFVRGWSMCVPSLPGLMQLSLATGLLYTPPYVSTALTAKSLPSIHTRPLQLHHTCKPLYTSRFNDTKGYEHNDRSFHIKALFSSPSASCFFILNFLLKTPPPQTSPTRTENSPGLGFPSSLCQSPPACALVSLIPLSLFGPGDTHFIKLSMKVCRHTSSVKIVCAVCGAPPQLPLVCVVLGFSLLNKNLA